MKRILLSILSLCLAVAPMHVYAAGEQFEDEQGLLLEKTGAGQAEVIGYDGPAGHVNIPKKVNAGDAGTFHITAIRMNAFQDNQLIESVFINKAITTIPKYAFAGCTMLYKVVFEEGSELQVIDENAFDGCTGLIDINIPARDEDGERYPHIYQYSFRNVPNITYPLPIDSRLTWPQKCGVKSMNLPVEGYFVFTDESKTVIKLCSTAAKGAVVVPEGVSEIQSSSMGGFANCVYVTSVVLPSTLALCGSDCFLNCTGFASIICKAVNPPDVNHYESAYLTLPAFKNVDKNIPVYVPESSLTAYKEALGWSQFFNYAAWSQETEDDISKYTITLQVNDANMGSVKGAGTFEGGSDVEIEAIPNEGYYLEKWSDNVTENPRVIKLNSDTTITAIFAEITEDVEDKVTLTLLVNDATMGVVTGGGTFDIGTTVNIAAVALGDYEFKNWSDGNKDAIRSFVLNENLTLTAIFGTKELPKFTVTLAVNDDKMGSVEGAGIYEQGTKVTIKATAKEGYQFVQWSDNDKTAIREIEVTQDINLTATFEALPEVQFTITVSANDPTMGTVLGSGVYGQNASVTIQAIPNEGYKFVKWNDEVTEPTRTFLATADAAFVAFFEKAEGIESIQSSEISIQKIIIDGQLYILREDAIYDARGKRVK